MDPHGSAGLSGSAIRAVVAVEPRSARRYLASRSLSHGVAAIALFAAGCAGSGVPGPAPRTAADPVAVAAAPTASGPAAEPVTAEQALATFDSAWVRIARTHYDSTFRGVDWTAVREELRPRAAGAATTGALRRVLVDMLGRLEESHYALIPREVADAVGGGSGGGAGDVGVELRIAESRVVVWRLDAGGPAAVAGARAGWVVESIDDRSVGSALARLEALADAPEARLARTQFLWSVNGALDGAPGTTVSLGLRDGDDRPVTLALQRRTRPGEPVRFGNLPTMLAELAHDRIALGDACVGIIRFNVWMAPVAPAFDRALDDMRDCAGIIVDLRGNPGGLAGMVMGVAGHFLPDAQALGVMRMRTSELRLASNPRTVNAAGQPVRPYEGPLALLLDGLSVSTSEIFAAGLQSIGRARVFGETSAGQALPANAARLPNEDVLMHVVADLTAPDGTRIEGRGVVPDQVVPLRRADLLGGRDGAFDAALRWILDAGPAR
jgi:carboxyl-terminal processing protease